MLETNVEAYHICFLVLRKKYQLTKEFEIFEVAHKEQL